MPLAYFGVREALRMWMIFPLIIGLSVKQVPVSSISEVVYKTSVDWINQRSNEALESFVIWSLDSILADLAAQLSGSSKGSKKGGQSASSKSQVDTYSFCPLFHFS